MLHPQPRPNAEVAIVTVLLAGGSLGLTATIVGLLVGWRWR